jgi:hypothetical protein|nr:phage scaffolding protein [uncultured Acetatifactor sp.]
MKNIEQILKEVGIEVTDEQKAAVNAAVTENYKTIAEFDKQTKKLTAAEADRDNYKGQLDTANETLEKFKDIDPEKQAEEIQKYKQAAKEAQDMAAKQILERDQRDYLKGEFDKLKIGSGRVRDSLMREIMGEDGLKWKDGAFMGLSDYLARENEKDHFYQTEAEKAEAEAKAKAAGSAPKFTDKSEPKQAPAKDTSPAPVVF